MSPAFWRQAPQQQISGPRCVDRPGEKPSFSAAPAWDLCSACLPLTRYGGIRFWERVFSMASCWFLLSFNHGAFNSSLSTLPQTRHWISSPPYLLGHRAADST